MVIKYVLSPYPALDEDLYVKVYEAQNYPAEVASILVPKPHNNPEDVVINGLDNLTHIVRLVTAVSNTELHRYNQEATVDTATIFDPIEFKIGDGNPNTPAAGDSDYINPDLAGLLSTDYKVYRRGAGFLKEGIDIGNNPVPGGFSLTQTGDVFNADEEFLIIRQPKVLTTVVNDSVVGKQFGGFVDINTATDYDPAHLRKLIRLDGVAAEYKFPVALGTDVPIGYVFRFTNFGTDGESGKVIFENAQLLWGSTPKDEIEVPFGSTMEFTFDGTKWNCTLFTSVPGAVVTPAAIIKYIGTFDIGDVGVNHDRQYNVAIPDQGTTNYRVLGTLVGYHASWDNDNDTLFIINDKQATSFKLDIKRLASTAHNLKFDYVIVR